MELQCFHEPLPNLDSSTHWLVGCPTDPPDCSNIPIWLFLTLGPVTPSDPSPTLGLRRVVRA